MRQVWTVGCQRSGSVWLARLLASALNCSIMGENTLAAYKRNVESDYIVIHSNLHITHSVYAGKFKDGDRIAVIRRDPRDVMVSWFHYRRDWAWETCFDLVCELPQWYADWEECDLNPIMTDYEMFITDTRFELRRVMDAIDLPIRRPLDEVVHEESFAQKKNWIENNPDKLLMDQSLVLHHMRKGIAGDWKNHLNQQWGRRIQDAIGDYLVALHYTADSDWWRQLPQ